MQAKRHAGAQEQSGCGVATLMTSETTRAETTSGTSTSLTKSKTTALNGAMKLPEERIEPDEEGGIKPLDLTTCIIISDSDEETKPNTNFQIINQNKIANC